MASRLHAAGIGKQHLDGVGRFRLQVLGTGPTRGTMTVRVNPDELQAAISTFKPNRLEKVLSSAGAGLMLSSVFSSAFEGVCVTGLLAGRGLEGTKRELIDRAFPHTPDRLLRLANGVHAKALANRRKFARAKVGGRGHSDDSADSDSDTGGSAGGSGGTAGGDSGGSGDGSGLGGSGVGGDDGGTSGIIADILDQFC